MWPQICVCGKRESVCECFACEFRYLGQPRRTSAAADPTDRRDPVSALESVCACGCEVFCITDHKISGLFSVCDESNPTVTVWRRSFSFALGCYHGEGLHTVVLRAHTHTRTPCLRWRARHKLVKKTGRYVVTTSRVCVALVDGSVRACAVECAAKLCGALRFCPGFQFQLTSSKKPIASIIGKP